MGIDVERIKEYNRKYKESQSKVMSLQAELDMNNKEIDRLCKELSIELGIEITRENVESIYVEKVKEINSSLELGESILNRIENEEKGLKESSVLEGELKLQASQSNANRNTGMMGNSNMTPMNNMQNFGNGMGQMGQMGQMSQVGQVQQNNDGFDSIGGMPQMEIKADENASAMSGNGIKNPFISQAMGSPVIPQMFSRNGGDIPSLSESDFDSI